MLSKIITSGRSGIYSVKDLVRNTTFKDMHTQRHVLQYVAEKIWRYEFWYRLDTQLRLLQESIEQDKPKELVFARAMAFKQELYALSSFVAVVSRGLLPRDTLFPVHAKHWSIFKQFFTGCEMIQSDNEFEHKFFEFLSFKSDLRVQDMCQIGASLPCDLLDRLVVARRMSSKVSQPLISLSGRGDLKVNLVSEFVEKARRLSNHFMGIETYDESIFAVFLKNVQISITLYANYKSVVRSLMMPDVPEELVPRFIEHPAFVENMLEKRGEIPALHLFMYAYRHWSEIVPALATKHLFV